jgi:hypothetical protein
MITQANLLKALLSLIVTVVLLMGSTACKPQETKLPFETLEKRDLPLEPDGKHYEGKEPKVFIIASADDIAQLGSTVSRDVRAQLYSLEYTQYLAIAVFRGLYQYEFEIERIVLRAEIFDSDQACCV